jgi:hypothetical protein
MNIIDKYMSSRLEKKGLLTVPSWDKNDPLFMFSGNGKSDSILELYKSAYARVSVIARQQASLNQKFFRIGKDVEVTNHALVNLFNTPTGDGEGTIDDLMYALAASIQIQDDVFIIFEYVEGSKYPVKVFVAPVGAVTSTNTQGIITYSYNNKTLQNKEFIKISGYSPISRTSGVSPLSVIKNYLTTEQLISYHQIGLFENNAIPAGAMTIEADPLTFEQVKESWERRFRGSGKNNQLAFIRKDPNKSSAGIEYTKYTTDNRNLDLKVVFDRIDQNIDNAFGVPKEMMGNITATNLAGVKLAKSVYWENVGTPLARLIDSKINGWIKYTYGDDVMIKTETPNFRELDEEVAEANKVKTNVETALLLIDKGYNELEVFEWLEIPSFKATKIEVPKSIKKKLVVRTKAITPEKVPEESRAISNTLDKYIEDEYTEIKALEDPRDLDNTNKAIILAALLLPLIIRLQEKVGDIQLPHYLAELGLPADSVSFTLSRQSEIGMAGYVKRVSESFQKETATHVSNIVKEAETLQWTTAQRSKELRNYYKQQGEYVSQSGKLIKNNARYRADRVVKTETILANNRASAYSMEIIGRKVGIRFEKISRRTNSTPEPICDHFNGRVVGLSENFANLGENVDIGGKSFVPSFRSIDVPPYHPNCQCYVEFREISN